MSDIKVLHCLQAWHYHATSAVGVQQETLAGSHGWQRAGECWRNFLPFLYYFDLVVIIAFVLIQASEDPQVQVFSSKHVKIYHQLFNCTSKSQ